MPSFVDLFAGCGGFSAGLRASGWKSVAEVEVDNWACDTLRANFPESRVIERDIRSISDDEILQIGQVDLIVGGPPCQGFSVAGATQFGVEDPRNELFRWFLRWITLLRPKAAVMENVPNILSREAEGGSVVTAIQSALGPLGYSVSAKIMNSADFGVPQARRRAFIVMLRNGAPFEFPSATHGTASARGDLFGCLLKPQTTVGEALSDLPVIEAGEGTDEPVPYGSPVSNDYQRDCRASEVAVANHVAMKHTSRLIERFKMISPGKSLKDVPLSHGQIANRTGETVKKPFKYNNYRLDPDKPSLAIPASFQSLFLHPSRNRNLTAREAARLMGFPDRFVFCGKRTTMSWEKHLSQYNQIGNAVCPPVASALGRALISQIGAIPESTPSTLGGIAGSNEQPLRRAISVPQLRKPLQDSVLQELHVLAAKLGEPEIDFRLNGMKIPSAALPLAIILANSKCCPLCSPDYPPHAVHDGEMCFLISKDETDSLLDNEQDHGLDYHLRTALGRDSQIGHYVGERLSQLGLVQLVSLQNPRTGRNVRGMRVTKKIFGEAVYNRVLEALSLCTSEENTPDASDLAWSTAAE